MFEGEEELPPISVGQRRHLLPGDSQRSSEVDSHQKFEDTSDISLEGAPEEESPPRPYPILLKRGKIGDLAF